MTRTRKAKITCEEDLFENRRSRVSGASFGSAQESRWQFMEDVDYSMNETEENMETNFVLIEKKDVEGTFKGAFKKKREINSETYDRQSEKEHILECK